MNRKKWNRRKLAITLIGVTVLGCIITAGIVVWEFKSTDLFSSDNPPPWVIEANAEIKLPQSAHNIQAYTDGWHEISAQVRFAMSPSDLPTFLKSTMCSGPLKSSSPELQERCPGYRSWWKPWDAQNLQGCGGGREGFYQRILVDMSDPNVYIVYVDAYEY